jgi:hypothetical protein
MTLHLRRIGGAMTAQVGAFFLLCILMGGWGASERKTYVSPARPVTAGHLHNS